MFDVIAMDSVLARSGSEYQSISSDGPPTCILLFIIVELLPVMYIALTSFVVLYVMLQFSIIVFSFSITIALFLFVLLNVMLLIFIDGSCILIVESCSRAFFPVILNGTVSM